MRTQTNPSEFLTILDASEFLKVKISTLYAWVYQRKIPFRKHGSRVVFVASELREWSERRRVPESGDSPLNREWDAADKCDSESPSSLKTRRNEETA